MVRALAEHDAILRQAVADCGGRIFKTIGDAVCAVFDEPTDGVHAAVAAQRALFEADWSAFGLAQPLRVRMALQSGEAQERAGDFAGLVLNRISRLLRAGHGGQVLLSQSVAQALERQPLDGVETRDLGARRLRDVPGADHIFQLEVAGLPVTFPPLDTLDAVAHNLPVALNACLDREAELARIRGLLLDTPARLVTLLGPGGIGKTRLALHAAAHLIDDFPGGVWFIDLSGIREAELVSAAVAATLGARHEAGVDPHAALIEMIAERELLLLLDNCEQIVESVARFIAGLLPDAPGLRVLATSRAPLEVRGEQRVDIGPLPIEIDDVAGPAVQLFIERAQQIRPSFAMTGANQEAVYEICRRVDGIPLALELAAARMAVLSPEVLRARLSSRLSLLTSANRDLPERHQTLRGAIEWSYVLLQPEEQTAFRRLAVFQGGWPLAGAQAVLGLDDAATMEVLGSLSDKSLLRRSETEHGETRYAMLETIQEYALEQLAQQDERDATRAAHAGYFLQLSEDARGFIEGSAQQELWLAAIDREIGNIRAALQSSLDRGDAELAIGLSINLWFYWSVRGLMEEGQRWLAAGLTLAAEVDQTIRARALRTLGNLCVERGELPAAESLYRASLDISRSVGHNLGIAQSLSFLGMVSGMQGHAEDERVFQTEALERCRALGVPRGIAVSQVNLAVWEINRGAAEQALELLDQTRAIYENLQDEMSVIFCQVYRGQILCLQGKLHEALELLETAEQALLRANVRDGLTFARQWRAIAELKRGNLALALLLANEVLEGHRQLGNKVGTAEAFETIAMASLQPENAAHGAEALGAAHYLRALCNAPTPPPLVHDLARARDALQQTLGAHAFAMCWERGRQQEMRSDWLVVAPPGLLELIAALPG